MIFSVVTLFPELLSGMVKQGVLGRALDSGLIAVTTWNPRDFTEDTHRSVDDRPFGGGPGMVMKAGPAAAAIAAAKTDVEKIVGNQAQQQQSSVKQVDAKDTQESGIKCVYLSPQGIPMSQQLFRRASSWEGMILLCGRYEGIDERVIETSVDEEWSLGDFVISGGELAAAVVIDGVSRLLPGVLGHAESALQDSFEQGLLDCAHYTRPEMWSGKRVPPVLLSGNHDAIRRWRLEQSLQRTTKRRPDLLDQTQLSAEAQELLRLKERQRKD